MTIPPAGAAGNGSFGIARRDGPGRRSIYRHLTFYEEDRPSRGVVAKTSRRRGVKDYHINIFFSEEDGGYIADIPDLGTCWACGRTPELALEALERVKSAWIATAEREGREVPPPRYRPSIYQAK